MCLITREKIKRAKKKITCYKLVAVSRTTGEFLSPFREEKIPKAMVNGWFRYRARGERTFDTVDYYTHTNYVVEGGFIHTYTNEREARRCLERMAGTYREFEYKLYECVIPRGVKYWVAEQSDEYASTSIKFIKELK